MEERADSTEAFSQDDAKTEGTRKKKALKRKKERGSKLVVSAEVSGDIWDRMEKRVESGEFESRSDLIRSALCRFFDT